MTYSLDFRKKVLEIRLKRQLTFVETSELFNIGKTTLYNWTKNLIPKTTRNKPATKIDMAALAADVEKYPDSYQYERASRLKVSKSGVGSALKRLRISYKKNPKSS